MRALRIERPIKNYNWNLRTNTRKSDGMKGKKPVHFQQNDV